MTLAHVSARPEIREITKAFLELSFLDGKLLWLHLDIQHEL